MDTSQNAAGLEKLDNPTKKYRKVTISVAVFLAFVSGMMVASNRLSQQIQTEQAQIDAVSKLSDTAYNVLASSQSLYILAQAQHDLHEHQSTHGAQEHDNLLEKNTAESVTEQQKLKDFSQTFRNILTILDKGGQTDQGSVASLSTEQTRPVLQAVQKIWSEFQPEIDEAVAYKVTDGSQPEIFSSLALSAQKNHENIYANINKISTSLNSNLQRQAELLQTIQVAGISLSLLFFLMFVSFFIRRLGKADQEAALARNETREILQTVGSGLFLLDRNLNIGTQYSAALERLLGQNNLAGKNLNNILSDMVANPRDLDTAGGFVQQLYNPRTKERLIASLNPLVRCPMNVANTEGERETRYFDFIFTRVYHKDEIARVLVNVSDVTHAVLLENKIQEEREQNDFRMEMLNTILKTDPQLLADFIRNTQERNGNINGILKRPGKTQADFTAKIRDIFREVHSLKGDASSLNLDGFVSLAEVLESSLKDLQRKDLLSGEDFLPLTVSLEEMFSLTEVIHDLNSRITGSGASRSVLNSEPVKEQFTKFVRELAGRNGKSVDFNCTGMDTTPLNISVKSHLNDLALQLLRNAVVHGIEAPQERLAKHKLAAGHLRLELTEESDTVKLVVEDDGAGINLPRIREKLLEMGTYTPEEIQKLPAADLIQSIFTQGFSTQDHSTEDAGRGVGMDIVKERTRQLGGKVSLSTKSGAYTRIILTIPKKR